MSGGWASAGDYLRSVEAHQDEVEDIRKQRRLEGVRRRVERNGLPDVEVVQSIESPHIESVAVHWRSSGICVFQPSCSCGWLSRRTFYVRSMAVTWWRNQHARPRARVS